MKKYLTLIESVALIAALTAWFLNTWAEEKAENMRALMQAYNSLSLVNALELNRRETEYQAAIVRATSSLSSSSGNAAWNASEEVRRLWVGKFTLSLGQSETILDMLSSRDQLPQQYGDEIQSIRHQIDKIRTRSWHIYDSSVSKQEIDVAENAGTPEEFVKQSEDVRLRTQECALKAFSYFAEKRSAFAAIYQIVFIASAIIMILSKIAHWVLTIREKPHLVTDCGGGSGGTKPYRQGA